MRALFRPVLLPSILLLAGWPTSSMGLGWDDVNPVRVIENTAKTVVKAMDDTANTVEKAVDDTVDTLDKAVDDTLNTTVKAADDIANTADKAVDDTGRTAEKALQDTGTALEKAAQDTGKTIEEAVHDVGDAGVAVYNFGVNQVKSIGENVRSAEERLKEGKFVDAVWHFSTDQLISGQENAAKAAQESELVRVAGQIAASAYGGPGGAAAYAAWLTYNSTGGDISMALKVGAITGAAAWATAGVADMPSGTIAEISQKTIMAGAIGGIAVAAAGGDEQAIQEGFLKAGGAVMIQAVYERETYHELDGRISRGDAYCMASIDVSAPCAPPLKAYKLDSDGNPVVVDGKPLVDVTLTDARRPHVGQWVKPGENSFAGESSTFMVTISKYPGMNAMALLHDHVSYAYNFDPVTNVWTIIPATVVTYYGTNVETEDAIRDAALNDEPTLSPPVP